MSDGKGGPLAVVIAGANVHDTMLLQDTLEAVFIEPPCPIHELIQHLCLDKGYDNPTGHAAAEVYGYVPHIRRIGEERRAGATHGEKPRRWVVERLIAWLNGCRSSLGRWAKRLCNSLEMIKLQCILLWYRRLHQYGF